MLRFTFFVLSIIGILNAQNYTRITDQSNPVVSMDTGQNYSGAAWIDYNNDGLQDLFATPSFLFKNNGSGNFEYIETEIGKSQNNSFSNGTSWADVDNDGDLDCFLSGNPSTLYLNLGDDNFAEYHYGDLGYVADYSGFNDNRGWTGAFGDYDNDGFVDLVITHPQNFLGSPAHPSRLMHYNGSGGFTMITDYDFTTTLAPYTVATWSDYNQDGDLDLFIGSGPAGSAGEDYLYDNQLSESGTAELLRITTAPLGTVLQDGQVWNWIDFDNDGDLDGFLTNYGGAPNRLYRNDNGSYTSISNNLTFNGSMLANIWGDIDNDGDLDVIMTGDTGNAFFINNGDGSFTSKENEISSTFSVGAAFADYDNDGDLDLFLSDGNAPENEKALFRNDTENSNHWLNIQLHGTVSNAAAIGARVKVLASINGKPTWQVREVSAQNSFNSHNSLRLHFGLADAQMADSLQIIWPSGNKTEKIAVSADQFLNYTEPVPDDFFRANFKADVRRDFGNSVKIQFSDLTLTGENNPATSWQWDFENDGVIDSDIQSPEWTYDSAAVYSVRLVVSDGSHSEEKIFPNYISIQRKPGLPIVEYFSHTFTDTLVEKRQMIDFALTAKDTSDYPLSFLWTLNSVPKSMDTSYSYRASSFGLPKTDTVKVSISNGFNEVQKTWLIQVVNEITAIWSASLDLPDKFALQENYPNPFNPETKIKYQLPESAHIRITIFNLLGQTIRTLVNTIEEPGYKHATWNGKDNFGGKVSSGFYFYRLEANQNGKLIFQQNRKMLLLK
ncbi:MAG: VCBS repeat-containing protein [Calditrichaeota bacterium]|nr:VCBS repeat-containing protein [Calditrichota bacterium]